MWSVYFSTMIKTKAEVFVLCFRPFRFINEVWSVGKQCNAKWIISSMVVYVCYAACRPHVESRSWYTRYNTNHTLCRYSKIQDDPHHSFMFNVANRSYKIQSPNLTLSGVGGSCVLYWQQPKWWIFYKIYLTVAWRYGGVFQIIFTVDPSFSLPPLTKKDFQLCPCLHYCGRNSESWKWIEFSNMLLQFYKIIKEFYLLLYHMMVRGPFHSYKNRIAAVLHI